MEKREFKVGDKVKIPKTKSADLNTPLHRSTAISNAKKINQDFLYVVENNHPEYILGADLSSYNSIFHFQDLEHYEEFPEKWVISLYPEVKKWIKDEFKSSFYTDDAQSSVFHFPNWENGNGFSIGNHTDNKVRKGYTRITLEQFKKHILKEKEMERKIIGYKLNGKVDAEKVAYLLGCRSTEDNGMFFWGCHLSDTGVVKKAEELGILDIWFEPVYEEKFKVGDWVTFEVDKCVGRLSHLKTANWDRNITIPIDSITHDSFKFNGDTMNKYAPHAYWSGAANSKEVFRKATPEEIEAAKAARKTIIKMYSSNKGEFEIEVIEGKAYYRPENAMLPKEWIKRVINSYDDVLTSYAASNNPYKITIDSIKVGCMEGTRREDWLKVYNLLK